MIIHTDLVHIVDKEWETIATFEAAGKDIEAAFGDPVILHHYWYWILEHHLRFYIIRGSYGWNHYCNILSEEDDWKWDTKELILDTIDMERHARKERERKRAKTLKEMKVAQRSEQKRGKWTVQFHMTKNKKKTRGRLKGYSTESFGVVPWEP